MQYCHWSRKSKSKVDVVPDYGLPPAAVFIDVAERLLATEILCQVQKFSELLGLPSRVPGWSVAG